METHPHTVDGDLCGEYCVAEVRADQTGVLLSTLPWGSEELAARMSLDAAKARRLAKALLDAAAWAEGGAA